MGKPCIRVLVNTNASRIRVFGKFTSFNFSKSVSDRLNTNIAFANVIYNLKSLTAFMRNKERVFIILVSLQRSSWRGYYGKAIFGGEEGVRELCCFYFVVPPSASCCFRMLLQVVSLRLAGLTFILCKVQPPYPIPPPVVFPFIGTSNKAVISFTILCDRNAKH